MLRTPKYDVAIAFDLNHLDEQDSNLYPAR